MIRRVINLCMNVFPAVCLLVAAVLTFDAWLPNAKKSIFEEMRYHGGEIFSIAQEIDWGTRHWIIGSAAVLAAAATIHYVPRLTAKADTEGKFKNRYRSINSWMCKWWKLSFAILLLLAMISWTGIERFRSDSPSDEFSEPINGFLPRVMSQGHGLPSKYLVFVPHDYKPASDRRWPTLIYLNGAGQNGDDGFAQISRNFGRPIWEMQRGFPFFVIAP